MVNSSCILWINPTSPGAGFRLQIFWVYIPNFPVNMHKWGWQIATVLIIVLFCFFLEKALLALVSWRFCTGQLVAIVFYPFLCLERCTWSVMTYGSSGLYLGPCAASRKSDPPSCSLASMVHSDFLPLLEFFKIKFYL